MTTYPLSVRQREVLGWIAYGLTDKEISGRVGVSENRVANIVRVAMRHLHAKSRTHAVAIWLVGYGVD